MKKKNNRYIQQWESEKIAIENGRWGPFIRFGKLMLKLDKKADGSKYEPEELKGISLEDVKKMILKQEPKAFDKVQKKKSATKKSTVKSTKKKIIKKK